MTDKVLKLVQNTPVRGEDATAAVVAFLRRCADDIENGDEAAHKAIILLYEDCGDQFRTVSRFCNATSIERAGIIAMASHDTLS